MRVLGGIQRFQTEFAFLVILTFFFSNFIHSAKICCVNFKMTHISSEHKEKCCLGKNKNHHVVAVEKGDSIKSNLTSKKSEVLENSENLPFSEEGGIFCSLLCLCGQTSVPASIQRVFLLTSNYLKHLDISTYKFIFSQKIYHPPSVV